MTDATIAGALARLDAWVERAGWKAYDPFDGLSSPYARRLTRNRPRLEQVWQQAVRRFPLNVRPLLGIVPQTSSKAMGFFAQGYLRLSLTRDNPRFAAKARRCLAWLCDHRAPGYRGHCWGNHFDYRSRGGRIPRGAPTIVWTGLIAHAFLDAHETLGDGTYLAVARSACEFIVEELGFLTFPEGILLRYYPGADIVVHNASMIGASLLARVGALTGDTRFLGLAEDATRFTLHHQRPDGAWAYGVGPQWAWIDSFHTGYVLEALGTVARCTGAAACEPALTQGYGFFVRSFFRPDGTPRYYAHKTAPIDIQCASQGIQTLVALRDRHPDSVKLATRVAHWTIAHMQDPSGYFYYRKYGPFTNRTPTLHWGQATMLAALASLESSPSGTHRETPFARLA